MKLDLNRLFKDFHGRDTSKSIGEGVAEALYAAGSVPEGRVFTREEKYKVYEIMQQIITGRGVIEISTEQATLLKEATAQYFNAGAYGQIEELIEKGK
jgi:dihydrodipicolinate synthase/N-acetylneuraminate lyase